MSAPRLLVLSAAVLGLVVQPAAAQSDARSADRRQMAAAAGGGVHGIVLDDRGQPLEGAVVSALGRTTAFAVTDRAGAYTLRDLEPGPYLVRVHLGGFAAGRPTLVEVRPAQLTHSSFTLLRAPGAAAPAVLAAGLAAGETALAEADEGAGAAPAGASEAAWRLRHLRRSVLKEAGHVALEEAGREWFLAETFERIGRAVESSARLAVTLFGDLPDFEGRVDFLATNAVGPLDGWFDFERARGVAVVSLGAAAGGRADWDVKVAVNQGDLSAWMLAGTYATRAPARHRYTVGWSYSIHSYAGGNPSVLATMADGRRQVSALQAADEIAIGSRAAVGVGVRYARYDYLRDPGFFSPRVSLTFTMTPRYRVRAAASLAESAPGSEEFLPPTRAQWLPPQRTFGPLPGAGFRAQQVRHVEVGLERDFDGATLGVRAFRQQVADQQATLFGLITPATPAANLGHYFVASLGDVAIEGWSVGVAHAASSRVRGSVGYVQARAAWRGGPPPSDRHGLALWAPAVLTLQPRRVHDLSSTLEAEIPESSTRVVMLYKVNSAYARRYGGSERAGVDGRFDVQLSQGLPFLGFSGAQWEMLLGIRNLFREQADGSVLDELLVVRPPKRIVGGVQVRF